MGNKCASCGRRINLDMSASRTISERSSVSLADRCWKLKQRMASFMAQAFWYQSSLSRSARNSLCPSFKRGYLTMTERIRSAMDRRSGTDRRKAYRLGFFLKGGVEKRSGKERRSNDERRKGWVRVGKWCGAQLSSLKIAKFLKQPITKASSKTGS
jgi:hypothetical protein